MINTISLMPNPVEIWLQSLDISNMKIIKYRKAVVDLGLSNVDLNVD